SRRPATSGPVRHRNAAIERGSFMTMTLAEPHPATILNVEDDPAIRSAVSRLLQSAGFRVREAATGDEALREAAANPDLIILDIQLPGLNGFEVCRRLK